MSSHNDVGLLLKADGRIVFANKYFCDLVGIKYDKVAGKSCFDFIFPEDMDSARKLIDTATHPHADPLRFRFRRLDGTAVWTDIQALPLQTTMGKTDTVRTRHRLKVSVCS